MHIPLPHSRRAPALTAALLVSLGALAACSSPSHPVAAASSGIVPGAGQSLAGVPGATSGVVAAASQPTGVAPTSTMTMTMSAPAGGAPAAPVVGNAVTIKNFAFAPANLMVKVGTTVTWTNQDSEAHTVTSQGAGGPLSSAPLNTGQSYSYTFTKPGTYAYLCTIHPFMVATVTVTS
jgi:plastocyanin